MVGRGAGGMEGLEGAASGAESDLYTVLYTNAHSIVNKIDELCLVVHEEKPDFM